jgi:Heavy-metal-associated domain
LPWVRKAAVDFPKKQVTVTVDSSLYEPKTLIAALKDAGFGGKLAETSEDQEKDDARAVAGSRVTFHVGGMKKTKSGAT